HIGTGLRAAAADRYAPLAFDPSSVFSQMVEMGWLGQKNGWGFYRYRGKRKTVNAAALTLLPKDVVADRSMLLSGLPPSVAQREAGERMVMLMVNEAARCCEEGLAESPALIDLAMVMGTGWAPHRGGPLHYADDRGLAQVVKALEKLKQRDGQRFAP